MSKRFGRNQKRKMAEKIKELEENLHNAEIINRRPLELPQEEVVRVSHFTPTSDQYTHVEVQVKVPVLIQRMVQSIPELYSIRHTGVLGQKARDVSMSVQREIEYRLRKEFDNILDELDRGELK